MVKSFFTITYSTFLAPPPARKHFSTENSFKKSKFSVLGLAGFENLMYFCTVFHGIRFKVSEDWLSGDNQFFLHLHEKTGQSENSVAILLSGYSFVSLRHETMASITDSIS